MEIANPKIELNLASSFTIRTHIHIKILAKYMIELDFKNNLHKLLLFIVIVSIFLLGYYLTPNENFYSRMLKMRIEESYDGKVLEKYTDSSNHCTPMLKLSYRNVSLENTFWDEVNIKDSIVKLKGESFITLYRNNNTKIIFDYEKYFEELSARNKSN